MKLGLTSRILLGTAGSVVLALALALGIASRAVKQNATRDVDRSLEETAARVQDALDSRQQVMLKGARSWAEVANGVRSSTLASVDSLEAGNGYDQAVGAAQAIGADWAQVVNAAGVRQGKSDEPTALRDSLGSSALVGAALEGKTSTGFGVAHDTLLFQAIAAPIFGASASGSSQGRIIGAVMAVRFLSDTLAAEIGRGTKSQVVFFALDQNDKPHLTGATFADRGSLEDFVGSRMMVKDTTRGEMKGEVVQAGVAQGMMRDETTVNGTHYIGYGRKLMSARGNAVGGFVGFRSRDEAEMGLDATRNAIFLAAVGGLLLAFVTSGLVARQVVRPVQALASAARRASEGDYAAEIPDTGSDEIGTLASAFRSLLADLRDKQALVDFLGASASGGQRTYPIASGSAPTLQLVTGEDDSLRPGQTFAGRYEVKNVLGVGGMGVVYKAVDRELNETVAIKTLKPEMLQQDPTALERFKSEIRLARRISHRNVVRTHDLGEVSGRYYITMEYVEGKSLKELIQARGRLPLAVVLPIAKQLCRALEVAHEEGVIHRDIKPQNMVVEGDGVLKVMDFGIARLATRAAGQGHTQQGMIIGTPEYMAPEQLMGEEIDVRADLYAVGIVLYECLTGKMPFEADNVFTLITRVMEDVPVAPAQLAPMPQALSDLVMRTMAKDRKDRPASARELHDLLDQLSSALAAVA
ncbi:MAG: protein kinase [Gemmatimonadetes bacterium]|nr:protein kinase [Gemmatimonadota bacterium]